MCRFVPVFFSLSPSPFQYKHFLLLLLIGEGEAMECEDMEKPSGPKWMNSCADRFFQRIKSIKL